MNNAVKIVLGILLTFVILTLSGVIGVELIKIFDFFPEGFFNQLVIIVFSGAFIYFFVRWGILNFSCKSVQLKDVIFPVGLALLLSGILNLYGAISGEEDASFMSMSFIQFFFIIFLLASVGEELLFRGFLQNMLEPLKGYGLKIFGIRISIPVLISGIFFGLIHFGVMTMGVSFESVLPIVIAAVFLGFIAGYYQEKHENFVYAVLVHMSGNLVGLLSTLFWG